MAIETLERPEQDANIENLPVGRSPLVELNHTYLANTLEGHSGKIQPSEPLKLLITDKIELYNLSEKRKEWTFDDSETIDLSIDEQSAYVDRVKALLGEQATFDLLPMDLANDEGNIKWLGAIADGHWPISVGSPLEEHDRAGHHDALVYSPPEQAILIVTAAEYAKDARIAGKDIVIPPEYASSMRGRTHEDNFVGHLDHITEGLGGLSQQTLELLAPLLDETVDFPEAIKSYTASLVEKVETFLEGDRVSENGIGTALALALMSLETITLATQNRDASPIEIKIALYNVIKGYVKSAAKLRGDEAPDTLLDFWSTDEQGKPLKMTNEELLTKLS